jgi:hypothetical protein
MQENAQVLSVQFDDLQQIYDTAILINPENPPCPFLFPETTIALYLCRLV